MHNNYKKEKNTNWQAQIREYFSEHTKLTLAQQQHIERLLLKTKPLPWWKSVFELIFNFISILPRYKTLIFSNAASIAVAVLCTTLAAYSYHGKQHSHLDFLYEISGLEDPSTTPPDFDLVSDANALSQFSIESLDNLDNKSFQPSISNQVTQKYSAYEGRFFQLDGLQGVSLAMRPIPLLPENKPVHKHKATLYIVKLSGKDADLFPKEKTLRKVNSSGGKMQRIYAWRDGPYGYAMVQQQNINTENQP